GPAAGQPARRRAIFAGREPWPPPAPIAERLIEHLTLTADRRGLDGCVGRLLEFERLGLTEIALAPHGDPAAAIELIGRAVIPLVDPDRAPPAPGLSARRWRILSSSGRRGGRGPRRTHDQARPPDHRGDRLREVARLVHRDARAQARVRDSRAADIGRPGRVRVHAIPGRDAWGAGAAELRL